MPRIIAIWVLRVLALGLVAATGLSLLESNQWWVRVTDFPRVQIFAALVVVLIGVIWIDRAWRLVLGAVMIACAGWQLHRIVPYTPFAAKEVAFVDPASPADRASCFTAMSFNVLQFNRDFAATAALIAKEDPDILLLLETDRGWADALAPTLARYPHRLDRPIDNTYGLMFATRLPMARGAVRNIAEEDTPSVFADLTTRGGRRFHLIGLHPRPPVPGQDTDERDAEIAVAAREAGAEKQPVLALGDFNDVAWAHTSRLFKRIGGYLDPRIGRGPFATFPADWVWLGWPLDHLFITPEFTMRSMRVGANIGSDHLPIHAEICLAPEKARAVNAAPDTVTAEDREDTREIMGEYAEDQADEKTGE